MGNRVTVAGAARLAALALVLVALAAVSGPATPAPAQGGDRAPAAAPARDDGVIPAIGMPPVIPLSFDGDVRTLPQLPPKPYHLWEVREPEPEKHRPLKYALQPDVPNNVLAGDMPAPSLNFAGLAFSDACTGGQCGAGWPPDVVGQVGLNYYIEAVNDAWGIYNKSGTLVASFTEDAIWGTTGTNPCSNGYNMGDPIVVYDAYSDRWILTNFAFALSGGNPVAPFYQCFVVSKTSDPIAGGWWLYAVQMDPGGTGLPPAGTLNDYPKFGLWTDCLYMAANEFTMPAGTFAGTAFASLSYRDMEKGAPLTWSLGYETSRTIYTLVPANANGNTPSAQPPAGRPGYFLQESMLYWGYEVRPFTAGANCGSGGSLGAMTLVTQATFTSPCGSTDCNVVAQPGVGTPRLDSLGDRLMQKVQYRNVGGVESLWVVHSVRTSASSTVRPQWAQIDITGGTLNTTPVQEQIYAPDTTLNRWMSSIAADNAGNAALGFSTSNGSGSNYPSISYAGRLIGDAAGTLGQGETQLYAGTGSQTTYSRWGDYTEMSVDPVDDCTFWYTDEYLTATGTVWRTRIGAFRYTAAQCVSSPVASTPHTIIFNGGVGSDWNAATERLGTAPAAGTTFDYYATWDASYLYAGARGSAEGPYTYVVVVDTDPGTQTSSNAGSSAALACAGGFNAHGKGDFALVRTGAALASGSVGATAKYAGAGGTWAAWAPGAATDAADLGRNQVEFRIAWADIGVAPASSAAGVYLYVCNGASLISAWPPENVQSGSPVLNVETLLSTHDTARVPRTYAWHSGDEVRPLPAAGAYSFLNGYAQLNVTAASGAACSFEARVLGNRDTTDTAVIRRGYRLTPSNCTALTADVTLKYEDGTTANNVPGELNGLAEGTLNLLRRSPNWVDMGATSRDATANTVTLNGVSGFSWWSLGVGSHTPTALEAGPAAIVAPDATPWVLLGGAGLLAAGALVLVTRRR